jgi:drug/metabolite transporter (DMT)-like permease
MSKSALILICLCSPVTAFTGVHTPFQQSPNGPAGLKIHSTTTTSLGYSRSSPTAEGPNSIKTALPVSNIAIPPGDEYESESAPLDSSNQVVVCDMVGCAVGEISPTVISTTSEDSLFDQFMSTYWGPRALLAVVACLYGTNFPLGAIMDHALPASAATSARFVLASLALSPFVFQIHRDLIGVSLFAGCFTGMGYVAQSMALVDTSPATVSFLGAAIVLWCPFLEWLVNKKPMGFNERPQTWIAAGLCLMGVGVLELCGGGGASASSIGVGDGLALLQAVGFGTGLFMSEQMMQKHPDQALPITAVLVSMTAFISMLWCLSDDWMGSAPGWESMTLPNLLFDPSLQDVAMAVVWTGLLSTSLNFFLENVALGKVPAAEASVVLATEPLWAAAFAAVILGESFGWNDYAGGFLIVAACLVNSVQAEDVNRFIKGGKEDVIIEVEALETLEITE